VRLPWPLFVRRAMAMSYVVFVVALGVYALYGLKPSLDGINVAQVLSFVILTFCAEAMPVQLPHGRGTVSTGYAVLFATVIVLGADFATWIGALATLRVYELTGKVSIKGILFNRAQLALSAAAAGLVYAFFGGVPGTINVLRDLPAMVAAALAYSLVNITTVVLAIHLTQRVSFWAIWVKDFRWMIPHYAALTPLGILIGIVQLDVGPAGVLLLLVPLVVARYSLQLYADMRKAYLATIQAMVAAIEARDPYTAGHSRRVARYTSAVARALRLAEDQIERLEYAAWLHDLGKLAVPDRVLNKRTALTPEEWELMKRHPENGASLLKQIKLLGNDVEVILHHHERWNGEGYPDLMRGEAIPFGARLIAIADAYEAMTSARPYRQKPLTKEEAMAELRRCAGTQFDPGLVEVFCATVSALPEETEEPEAVPVGATGLPVSAAGPAAACEEAAAVLREAAGTKDQGGT